MKSRTESKNPLLKSKETASQGPWAQRSAQQKLPEVTSYSHSETTEGIQDPGEYSRIRTIPRTRTQSSAHRPDPVSPKTPLLFPQWLKKDDSASLAGRGSEFPSPHMGSPLNHPQGHSLSRTHP